MTHCTAVKSDEIHTLFHLTHFKFRLLRSVWIVFLFIPQPNSERTAAKQMKKKRWGAQILTDNFTVMHRSGNIMWYACSQIYVRRMRNIWFAHIVSSKLVIYQTEHLISALKCSNSLKGFFFCNQTSHVSLWKKNNLSIDYWYFFLFLFGV